jgi:DNA-binding YbaB/EbfC family protein
MLGNLGGMMKQMQEAQRKMQQMQEELAEMRLEASAGGGLVTCMVDGVGNVLDLTIDGAKLGLDADDAELLQDSVLAAVQEAVRAAQESGRKKLEAITGGMGLPPGLGL